MSDSVHIEPCPFCGMREATSNALVQEFVSVEPKSLEGALRVSMDGFGWYWVYCGNCQAMGPRYHGAYYSSGNTGPKNLHRDKDKTAKAIVTAVQAWNERAKPTLFDMEEEQ